MIYITRRERFSAAHKLWNAELSDDENTREFGKCSNEYFHGHNYELFVTIKGVPDPKTSYVMDMKKLSSLICKHIIDRVDHKNLNMDVDFLGGINPTTENLLMAFWKQLAEPIAQHNCKLHKLKLVETENNYGEYYGE